jgi:methylmalonyl-CoA/ethylmalonyl-CoA epimerase
MPKIEKINHVALVVENIQEALAFWQDALGLPLHKIEQVPREASAVAFLPLGDSEIELVEPTSPHSGVARFLAKRGPGMHHLCLEVDNIAAMAGKLKAKGIRLIQEEPVIAEDGRQYMFIHPQAAYGVLVELYQLPREEKPPFPILETPRLLLRQFQPADIPAVFEMYTHPELTRWLEHEPMTSLAEAEQRVRARKGLFERGMGCRWAITFKNRPEDLIGSCGYFSVRISTHTYEMGYDLHPDYWRQGLMTEALTAVLQASFQPGALYQVHRLEALVEPGNVASMGLLSKLGFNRESIRREFGYWKGAYRDVAVFALLAQEWGQ